VRTPARHSQPALLTEVLAGQDNPGKVVETTTDFGDIAEADAAMDDRRAIKALVNISDRRRRTS
jgi:alcohol dehydrogenase